jgi:hypothetical protein
VVEELEENLYALGDFPLFRVRQYASGHASSAADIDELTRRAYDTLSSRYALHLEWYSWPSTSLGPADPSTPVTFELGDETDVETPYLVAVPNDPDETGRQLERRFGSAR